jgi:hypothetical protein
MVHWKPGRELWWGSGQSMRDNRRGTTEIRAENGSLEDGRELGMVGLWTKYEG